MQVKTKGFKELPAPEQLAIMLRHLGYMYPEIVEALEDKYKKVDGEPWSVRTVQGWFTVEGKLREIADEYDRELGQKRAEKLEREYAETDENILRITTMVIRLYGARMNAMTKAVEAELAKPNPDFERVKVGTFDFMNAVKTQRIVLGQTLGRYGLDVGEEVTPEEAKQIREALSYAGVLRNPQENRDRPEMAETSGS